MDAAGNVAITGYFLDTSNFGGDDLTSIDGKTDIFIARYSSSGLHLWSQRFGNSGYDYGWAIGLSGSGDALLAGEFDGPVDFGGGPLDNPFEISRDIFLAKYTVAVDGVEAPPQTHVIDVAAYPNPFKPQATIRYTLTERGRVRLRVYDASGKRIVTLIDEERSPGSHFVRWGGRDERGIAVSPGVYFVSLEQGHSLKSTKVTLIE